MSELPNPPPLPSAAAAAAAPGAGAPTAPTAPPPEPLSLRLTRVEKHDLFTPLNQIIGYSELLIEEAQEAGGAAEPLATLTKVHAAAQRLNGMLAEIRSRAAPTGPGTP
ncbi:MAG: hypothetical protein HZA54_00955 [Planctomycetes bacterium]|nr:hypothetical protein [Planctomycetota bacterium]